MNLLFISSLVTAALFKDVSPFIFSSWPNLCEQVHEYKAMLTTLHNNPCISDTQIWMLIEPLRVKSRPCLTDLIGKVAGYAQTHLTAGKECECSHDFDRAVAVPLGFNRDHYTECVSFNPNCEYLYNYFYLRPLEYSKASACQPHYHVWTHLRDIYNKIGVDSQGEMILHLSYTYSKGHEHVCQCHLPTTHGPVKTDAQQSVTSSSTTKTTTTSIPTTTINRNTKTSNFDTSKTMSTTVKHADKSKTEAVSFQNELPSTKSYFTGRIPTKLSFESTGTVSVDKAVNATAITPISTESPKTTATQLTLTTNCQKYRSVSTIASAEKASHPLAYLCPSGNRTSSEAFVMVNCNVGSPEYWKEGPDVMKNCDRMPIYTPIATFGTQYLGAHEHEGLSGIFLGCIPGGFKIAYQDCDTEATIKHITSGLGPVCLGALFILHPSRAWFFSRQTTPSPACEFVSEYIALRSAISGQPCLSDTQIWSLLEPVAEKQRSCFGRALSEITAYVEAVNNPGKNCECNGDFSKNQPNFIGGGHDNVGGCLYSNPDCKYLSDYFYLQYGHRNELSHCQTHHHVWKHLRDMHNVFGSDLQADTVLHLSATYSNGRENTCTCTETQTTTLVPSTTSSVTQPPQTATKTDIKLTSKNTPETTSTYMKTSTQKPAVSLVTPQCKKYDLISDIANSHPESHPDARQCSNGNRTSHEAYVMVNCNLGSPDSWQKGKNVMAMCDKLPTYTPVAAVKTDSAGIGQELELSGIFVGCITGGFKLAYQDCDYAPSVVHIEGRNGTGKHDPNNYYVIMTKI